MRHPLKYCGPHKIVSEDGSTLSCGAVVVRQTDVGWLTLMLRAYKNWDFPKGMCEDGERPMETALREVGEESGISELTFDWGDRYTETGPYHRGKVARYYLAITIEEKVVMGISPELGRPEHHRILRGLVVAFGRGQQRHVAMLPKIKAGGTDQVANIFDEQKVHRFQIQLVYCLVNHMCVKVTGAAGTDLYCSYSL